MPAIRVDRHKPPGYPRPGWPYIYISMIYRQGSPSATASQSTARPWAFTRIAIACAWCRCRAATVIARWGDYSAPNLKAILGDPNVLKMFHFARFDVAILEHYLGVTCRPVYCTKIASKLTRTYTDRHGLKDLCRELLGIDLSKQQQSSDWGAAELTPEQQTYAASDVLHLHEIKTILDAMLAREGRTKMAQACFDFLPHRARLDLMGWNEVDIFHH